MDEPRFSEAAWKRESGSGRTGLVAFGVLIGGSGFLLGTVLTLAATR